MTITITAFENSPDQGQGLARDMRVRWALEELDLPYEVRLVSMKAMKEPAHRALNPFGQIPTYQENDLALFESGAIILWLAERNAGLLPVDTKARASAIKWLFAALNTVEPPIIELEMADVFEREKPWYAARCRCSRNGFVTAYVTFRVLSANANGSMADSLWVI